MADTTIDSTDGISEVDLHNEAALSLSLASERVNSARAALELRQLQLESLIASISTEYSEGGKFKVTGINVDKRKVSRVLQEKV